MSSNRKAILGFVTGAVALALLFVAWVYPEVPTATYSFAVLLLALLGVMAWLNQKELKEALKTRSLRYGTNALITIGLVFGILLVLNFLNFNHFARKDLTKNKVHSLSDQTVKILKDLKQDTKFTVFVKTAERDMLKGIIDNFLYHTKKIAVEYVDPDRDPTRAKAANVKKYGTVIVQSGKRDSRVDEVTEEKLTNALIKVLKEKSVMVCFMTGHGEKNGEQADSDGYSMAKKDFGSQNYESKAFNLLEEGKIPSDCNVLLVLGPTKAFFEKEISVLKDWLDAGGRALFALDPEIKGSDQINHELKGLLSEYSVQVNHDLVIDPTSRLLGVNASVPIVGIYSKEHPITRDFQVTTLFPLSSTVELKPNPPSTLKTWWLAKSTPKSFAKSDFKEIASGQVKLDEKKDKPGSFPVMVAVEGTRVTRTDDKKNLPQTRLVVMGTSQVGSNRWAGHGSNIDLFLNSVSWLADDESLISIRAKEEEVQVPSLSQTEARYIQLLTMIFIPGGLILAGVFVWRRRRTL